MTGTWNDHSGMDFIFAQLKIKPDNSKKVKNMDVNDLINPLRYVNLKDIDPESIKRMGEGVFPEPSTLDHLRIIDLVTKAYQGVHMPTLGHPIPQSTNFTAATIDTSSTGGTLITASANEVIEILGISVKTVQSYEVGAACNFQISNSNGNYPIMELSRLEEMASTGRGIIYGVSMYDNGAGGGVAQHITPARLFVNGGDSLAIQLDATPAEDMIFQIVYRKVVQ